MGLLLFRPILNFKNTEHGGIINVINSEPKIQNHGNQHKKNRICDGMSSMSRFRRGAM